jgi:RNA polymerase sigma-70 factor (ECF subfamily)
MPKPDSGSVSRDATAEGAFVTTHWSVVLATAGDSSEAAQAALERLCQTYWYPLYVYLLRRGYAATDAEDLVQEFFYRLIQREGFSVATPERGRFRSFLLASLNHFAANQWKQAHRLKRGGGAIFVPLEKETAESRYASEPAHEMTPERVFDRRWALTVIEQGLKQLREEYCSRGKAGIFEGLKMYITGEEGTPAYSQVAARLGKSEEAIKMAVSRLRQRYREIIRAEVARTVENPADVENELSALLSALT